MSESNEKELGEPGLPLLGINPYNDYKIIRLDAEGHALIALRCAYDENYADRIYLGNSVCSKCYAKHMEWGSP